MRPIFGALAFTFIISFHEIETADRSSENEREEKRAARAHAKYLRGIKRAEAAQKAKEDEEAFSETLRNIGVTGPSKKEEDQAGASRASRAHAKPLRRLTPAEAAKKKEEDAKAFSELLGQIGVTGTSLKEVKEAHPKHLTEAAKKEMEDAQNFSKLLRRIGATKASSSTARQNTDGTYGTSRATKRKVVRNSELQPVPNFDPQARGTSVTNSMLPMFKHVHDRSGDNVYEAHTNHYSGFPQTPPHVGGNSLPLYENTVSPVPGGMYMDSLGNHHLMPHHPPQSTGNDGYDHLAQSYGGIPPSGPSSYSPLIQNPGDDHFLQSHSAISSGGPSSYPPATQSYVHDDSLQSHGANLPSWLFPFPPSIQNHDNDLLLQSYGLSPPSMLPFAPPLIQNDGHDHLLQSHGVFSPSGPSSQHQGFQHQQDNYYFSESPATNHVNAYPSQSGGSGPSHGSGYPHQK